MTELWLTQPPFGAVLELCAGGAGRVLLREPIVKKFAQAIDNVTENGHRRRRHLQRYFGEFCNRPFEQLRLGDEKFKKERNFVCEDGATFDVRSFHAFDWTLFGVLTLDSDRRCFVGIAAGFRNEGDGHQLLDEVAQTLFGPPRRTINGD